MVDAGSGSIDQHVGDGGWRTADDACVTTLALLLLVDVVFVFDDDEQELLVGSLCVMAGTVMVRWGMGRNWEGMRGVSWYVLLIELDVSRLRGDADASRVGVLEWDCCMLCWCGCCCLFVGCFWCACCW